MFIAKIQKALTNPPKMLIYNESRTIMHESDLSEAVDKLMGVNLKVYARCKLTPTKEIEIINLIKAQKW